MKKEHRTNRRYSAEFKIRAILDMRTNHLGYNETVYKYWDVKNSVCYTMQQMICSESENLRKKLIRDMTKERSRLRAYIRNCKDEISCREAQEKINKLSKYKWCHSIYLNDRQFVTYKLFS